MKKTASLLGLLLVGATMTACGTPGYHDRYDNDGYKHSSKEGMTSYMFYRMDADGNGYVSRPEHEAFASGMFTRTDTNADGFVTYSELLAQKEREWSNYHDHYAYRDGARYDGDKYYPYGKGAPTVTPNEPYVANRGKTDRSYRDYDIRNSADDYNRNPRY